MSAHQSIIDVAINSPSPGVVDVYILTKNGIPSPEVIKIVQNYLNDEKIRPLTDYVRVFASEKVEFSINANIADAESVIKTIDSKMKEYKVLLSEKLGKDVIKTQIISILNSIYGVFKVNLETPEEIDIKEYQWADLVDWNIVIEGYANE